MKKYKKLTGKQLIFAKGRAEGLNNTAAAKKAGYACPNAQGSQTLAKISKHPDFMAMMDRAGLSERKLFAPLKAGLTATKTATYEGDVCPSDEPDHDTRLKSVEIAFKLRGRLGKGAEEKAVQNNQINVYNFKDARTEDLLRSIHEQLRAAQDSKLERPGDNNRAM